MSEVVTVRLPKDLLERLAELARQEGKDRSSLIREFLEDGIRRRRLDHALELYSRGEVSAWRAAQLAGISLWRFYELLKEHGLTLHYSSIEEDLGALDRGGQQ